MVTLWYKWAITFVPFFQPAFQAKQHAVYASKHPYYVTVTEIEHNAADKTLEVSVKIFTDDFEKTLRKKNKKTKVDLINPSDKITTDSLVQGYVLSNLAIKADGKPVTLKYLGYEIQEEAVYSYYEAADITQVKKINVTDRLLYDYKKEQYSIIHVKANGKKKSTRLKNPASEYNAEF